MDYKQFLESDENRQRRWLLDQRARADSRRKNAEDKRAEADSVDMSDAEIVEALRLIKSKKYDAAGNHAKCLRMQSMRLIKRPNHQQASSSFGFPWYLTDKGINMLDDAED